MVVIVAQQSSIILIGDGRLARHLRRYFQQLDLKHAIWSRRMEAEECCSALGCSCRPTRARSWRSATPQFSSVFDFLKANRSVGPTCLVLDVRLPARSGLELQRELAAANRQLPIIFITAHADVPMTVQAMKGGAIEFLTKPFRDQGLLDAVVAGLARDRARRESDKALRAVRERFDTLSPREREVMVQVTAGRLNKQIANDIGIAESTVKVHRTNLMRKMKARSVPELSRMADSLNLAPQQPKSS